MHKQPRHMCQPRGDASEQTNIMCQPHLKQVYICLDSGPKSPYKWTLLAPNLNKFLRNFYIKNIDFHKIIV